MAAPAASAVRPGERIGESKKFRTKTTLEPFECGQHVVNKCQNHWNSQQFESCPGFWIRSSSPPDGQVALEMELALVASAVPQAVSMTGHRDWCPSTSVVAFVALSNCSNKEFPVLK